MHEAFVDALKTAVATLIGHQPGAADRFGIAVSGGPDSMALLAGASEAWPGRVAAATVDHRLRPDSAAEAAMVAGWCADAEIPHETLTPEAPIEGSVQAAARLVRYRLLGDWADRCGIDWIMTAHHADDQLETMLMRLRRGSGVAGMAGIRARRGRVLRPLLGMRGTDLRRIVAGAAVPFVDDPSNADPRYDRARLRIALARAGWLDAQAASRSAAALGDAETALAWSVDTLVADHVRDDGSDGLALDRTDLPREYLRRILAVMVACVAPDMPPPRGSQLDEAIVQLCHGKRISIGGSVATGGPRWTVHRSPARRAC